MSFKTLSIASLLLAGCASTPPPAPPAKTVTVTEYVYADCGTPPQRAPIEFRAVEWEILDIGGEQRFTLPPGEYEDLAFNTSEIVKGVKELKAEIQFYVACLNRQGD